MSFEILQADCKRAVAQIANLNNEELDQIMNNEEKIGEIMCGIDQVSRNISIFLLFTSYYNLCSLI